MILSLGISRSEKHISKIYPVYIELGCVFCRTSPLDAHVDETEEFIFLSSVTSKSL